MLRPLLGLLFMLAALVPSVATAQPAHCERPLGSHRWPVVGEPIGNAPATAVTAAEALASVRRFRRHWRSVPRRTAVLRAFTECMNGSRAHFVVRRISISELRSRLSWLREQGFAAAILAEDLQALPNQGWVWDVYWGGASNRFMPSGAISGFLSQDGRTLIAAVHWPEG